MDWQVSNNTRLSGRWVHNYDAQQFAYGTTTASWNFPLTVTERRNGPGTTLSFTLSHNFSPTLTNEFVYGAGRGGVTIAPADDKATRGVTGVNTPMLFPTPIPGVSSRAWPSAASPACPPCVNTSVFGPFDQRFVINNFIDNLTKVSGKHTFKFGVYYQRASNQSNSQTNVEGNIDFANSAPTRSTPAIRSPTRSSASMARTPRRAASRWPRTTTTSWRATLRTRGR